MQSLFLKVAWSPPCTVKACASLTPIHVVNGAHVTTVIDVNVLGYFSSNDHRHAPAIELCHGAEVLALEGGIRRSFSRTGGHRHPCHPPVPYCSSKRDDAISRERSVFSQLASR